MQLQISRLPICIITQEPASTPAQSEQQTAKKAKLESRYFADAQPVCVAGSAAAAHSGISTFSLPP
jgi:hypothetical protein